MNRSKAQNVLAAGALAFCTALLSMQVLATELAEEAGMPFDRSLEIQEVPYGETVAPVIENYGRVAPFVATGGMITEDAMAHFRDQGIKTVISLLTLEEGVEEHARQAEEAGLDYVNIGVTSAGPGGDQVERFRELVGDPDNYPILVHCASANRVGSIWARYRIEMGVPTEVAFQEARAVGLQPELEQTVRTSLAE